MRVASVAFATCISTRLVIAWVDPASRQAAQSAGGDSSKTTILRGAEASSGGAEAVAPSAGGGRPVESDLIDAMPATSRAIISLLPFLIFVPASRALTT